MRIIQITDSHISADFPQRSVDLKNCIQVVNAVEPPADLVVHTGDVAHQGLGTEYSTAKELLDDLSAPYLVLAGNRDSRQELLRYFAAHTRVEPGATFVQYSVEDHAVRLIVIDTTSDVSKGELCAKRLAHVDQLLSRDTEKPTIVFMHHNPFEATEIPDPFQFKDWTDVESLLAIFQNHPQIKAVYCGHIHRNVNATAANLPVRALSCVACDLRKGKLSKEDAVRPMFNVIDV